MTGRRQFITLIGGLGLSIFFAKGVLASIRKDTGQTKDYFPYLISVVEAQSRRWGFELDSDEKECLSYACKNINPMNHAELAAVVALGAGVLENNKTLIDEYVLRRNGMSPRLIDHPLLDLSDYGAPMTYRLPIYQEQLIALIRKLTGYNSTKSKELLRGYQIGDIAKLEPLKMIALKDYKESLGEDELFKLDLIISEHAGHCQQYYFCSTLADRVENMTRVDYDIKKDGEHALLNDS